MYFLKGNELKQILGISDASRMIKRVKFKNGLDYPEAIINSWLIADEFGISHEVMDSMIEKLRKEEEKNG